VKRSVLLEMQREMLRVMFSYDRAVGERGYFLATHALESKGFTAVRKISDKERIVRKNGHKRKIFFGSLMASKAKKRYVIQLESRRRLKKNGEPNVRYKLTTTGFKGDFDDDAQAAERHFRAKTHWVAVRIDDIDDSYSVFFGSLEQLNGRSAIPMDNDDVKRYACLARNKRLTDAVLMREPEGEKTMKNVPPEILKSLKLFRSEHPNPSKTAFIMMQFGRTTAHGRITSGIRDILRRHGITALRADDKEYHRDLFSNILTHIYGSGFGVAVFERIEADKFNPNVALEVGYMMALGREICLLKDKTLTHLSTDLMGKLYREFDPQNPEDTIAGELVKWARDKKIIRSH